VNVRDATAAQLLEYPEDELQPIVRSVLQDDSAEVAGDTECGSVAGLSTGPGTLALERLSGRAETIDGLCKWSVVVKAMQVEGLVTSGNSAWMSPEAEIAAYQSVLCEPRNSGMRPARCYKVDPRPDGQTWLWIEDLSGLQGSPWMLENYLVAAKDLGIFSGKEASRGQNHAAGLKTHPGESRFTWHSMRHMADQESVENFDEFLRGNLPTSTYRTSKKFGDAIEAAESKFGKGESILVHGDCHARNMFVVSNPTDHDQTVAIDWAGVGLGSVGVDVGTAYGSGLTWGQEEFSMLADSEPEFFEYFSDGFSSAAGRKISQNERLDYLYYVCGYAKYFGIIAAVMVAGGRRQEFMLARSGEPTTEKAYESMIHRGERLEHLADELIEMAR
jgi:hypothetical protein